MEDGSKYKRENLLKVPADTQSTETNMIQKIKNQQRKEKRQDRIKIKVLKMKSAEKAIAQARKKAEEEAKKKAEEEAKKKAEEEEQKKKDAERMERLRPLIEKANKDAERAKARISFFESKRKGTFIPKK